MNSDKEKINNQRVTFSRKMKRKILLSLASGKSPDEAFLACAFNSLEDVSHDKKYAAKLLHKWKKELYDAPEMLNFLNYEISKDMIYDEIKYIGTDEQMDEFEDFEEYKEEVEKIIKTHKNKKIKQ